MSQKVCLIFVLCPQWSRCSVVFLLGIDCNTLHWPYYQEVSFYVSECHSVSIITGISIISAGSIEVLWFLCCHARILCESEDRHKLKIPVLFIFAENDYIPMEQFGRRQIQNGSYSLFRHGFAHRKRGHQPSRQTPNRGGQDRHAPLTQ